MRRALCLLCAAAAPALTQTFWERMQSAAEQHLGRPYVWGTAGLKSFDCSGFVWRVLADSGILLKRTTARKLYFSLPAVERGAELRRGNIVFFDSMKHCGIVESPSRFYHAQVSRGANLSPFAPYWGPKVCGYRRLKGTDD
jgi:cell wall-associated NlpC family hydrolase